MQTKQEPVDSVNTF